MLQHAVCLLCVALAGGVLAQEAIPTAAHAVNGGAPVFTPADTLMVPGPLHGADNILRARSACGAPPTANGKPDRAAHGEVFASVGSHGYREAGGAVCVPLGDHASATLAVDAGRVDRHGWRH